jgi:hypothetical protein
MMQTGKVYLTTAHVRHEILIQRRSDDDRIFGRLTYESMTFELFRNNWRLHHNSEEW